MRIESTEEQRYFQWLCLQAGDGRWLMQLLHQRDFEWVIYNDDNRAADGVALREEFSDDFGSSDRCSFLEMLLAISRRLSFEGGGEPREWFNQLLVNTGLDEAGAYDVGDILDRVIWRAYEPNGLGGLFPLIAPREDQRYVELWYQLQSYLLERD